MLYLKTYCSKIGLIYLASDGEFLTGVWFKDSRDATKHIGKYIEKDLPIFEKTCKWLDIYFSGQEPDFTPKYKIKNLTPFRKLVLDIIKNIPYGQVITYNDIAKKIFTLSSARNTALQIKIP